ncbi:MAG: T9SS type A sorting domain-containing protein [Bacteroidetes bacterium]|nr:T9SS type A sorting domain-containing protein [Bacteroidota bacterium]
MKKLALILIGGLSLFISRPVKAQLPNGGFENWDTTNLFLYKLINPKGWMSNNMYWQYSQNASAVVPSTDAHSGNYSAMFRVLEDTAVEKQPVYMGTMTGDLLGDNSTTKFPISGIPSAFNFWYKMQATTRQNLIVSVYLYKNDDMLHSQEIRVDSIQTDWTKVSTPLTYSGSDVPDSASISFIFGYGETYEVNAALFLDDLSLEGISTSLDEISSNSFELYPNPASDEVSIQLAQQHGKLLSASILSLDGREIQTVQFSEGQTPMLPTNMLNSGLYLVRIQTEKWTGTKRLVIQ